MSWQVPIVLDDTWKGKPFQHTEWLNHMIRGTNMRLLTAYELTLDPAFDPIPELAPGDDIQTVSAFRAMRENAFDTLAKLTWVQPDFLAVGIPADFTGYLYSSGGAWTQLFVDDVNAKLTEWGCDPMGLTYDSEIPWTRITGPAYASPGLVATSFGAFSAGDVLAARQLFNEWRAALEVLTTVLRYPTIGSPPADEGHNWTASTVEESTCEDAKGSVAHDYAEYSTESLGHVEASGGITGFVVVGEPGGDFSAGFSRYWSPIRVVPAALTNASRARAYAVGSASAGVEYNDFGDGWAEGMIGQVEEAPIDGTPLDFLVSPFPWGTCSIDLLPCPESGNVEHAYQVTIPGVVYDLDYPEPDYTAPDPDPFYPAP